MWSERLKCIVYDGLIVCPCFVCVGMRTELEVDTGTMWRFVLSYHIVCFICFGKEPVGFLSKDIIQADQKVSVHLKITVQYNWWFEDGHHRIHSERGPCYTEHGLREHSSACQISGDWRGTLWILLLTFCIVIIRCTETFSSPYMIFLQESIDFQFQCTLYVL